MVDEDEEAEDGAQGGPPPGEEAPEALRKPTVPTFKALPVSDREVRDRDASIRHISTAHRRAMMKVGEASARLVEAIKEVEGLSSQTSSTPFLRDVKLSHNLRTSELVGALKKASQCLRAASATQRSSKRAIREALDLVSDPDLAR
jgi:hypothetical protein